MNTALIVFIVYLIDQVDKISSMVGGIIAGSLVILGLSLFVAAFTAMNCSIEGGDFEESIIYKLIKSWWKKFFVTLFLLCVIKSLIPTSDTMTKMGIAYGASELLQSEAAKRAGEEISKIAGKTTDVVNKKLDKILEEK